MSLHGIFTPRPRRHRVSAECLRGSRGGVASPRKIHVAAAAAPRFVSAEGPRGNLGGTASQRNIYVAAAAASRLRGRSTSRPRRRRDSSPRKVHVATPATTPRLVFAEDPRRSGAATRVPLGRRTNASSNTSASPTVHRATSPARRIATSPSGTRSGTCTCGPDSERRGGFTVFFGSVASPASFHSVAARAAAGSSPRYEERSPRRRPAPSRTRARKARAS